MARRAARTGDKYDELRAKAAQYASKQDWRKAAKSLREAIALRPEKAAAYSNLGAMLCNSGHYTEAAQRLLEAKERASVGSEGWAEATANAFNMLRLPECAEVAKPEWWNDEGLKALSARVVRAEPNDERANAMRAHVLSGQLGDTWKLGPRLAAEVWEAATHYKRAVGKAEYARGADRCRAACSVVHSRDVV